MPSQNGTNFGNQKSTGALPPLKETNKFSSWADKSLFDQVDDILFDQEESKNKKKQALVNEATFTNQGTKMKDSILSLSGSLDLDGYDIEDELSKPALGHLATQKAVANGNGMNKDLSYINQNESSNSGGSGNGSIITDSLDLDNSDDLNKIISKYESMLGSNAQQQPQKPNRTLEESWGAPQPDPQPKQTPSLSYEEDYSDEDFEHSQDSADDKLVDEEIYMNSSLGSKDSQFLKELMDQPIRTKHGNSIEKQTEMGKSAAAKVIAHLEGSGEYSDDIDEFIRKHIENEEKEQSKLQVQDQQKQTITQESTQSTHSSSSSSDADDVFEEDKRTPKEILLDELKKLSDIFGKYSLTDREMFLSDVDNILKILTYQETVEYILPVLDIYANEQEFLKLQFFQKLPFILSKLLKTSPNKVETVDILNVQIFPLVSKLMINSEEQVQTEGVDALLKLAKEGLDEQDVKFLVVTLVQIIMAKADSQEAAKIAVLMIVEKFAEEKIFKETECLMFLDQYLGQIQKGMLFKIKKFLIPTLLAVSKHISYQRFEDQVYPLFIKFSQDDIWGVRKVCVEKLQDFLKLIQPQEFTKLNEVFTFLHSSLNDSSRWVKNQAFQSYGYIIHELYLKSEQVTDRSQHRQLIKQSLEVYYDTKFIASAEEEQSICQSFMGNQNDDVDKVKQSWAFFLGCALFVNGGEAFWQSKIRSIYDKLYKDILITVRKTLAASLTDVAKLVDMTNPENQEFFMKVITHFTNDIDEIKAKVTPQLCQLLALYPADQHSHLLSTLIREQIGNISGKGTRDSKISLLEQIYQLFSVTHLADQEFHQHLIVIIEQEQAIQYKKRACKLFGSKVVAPLIKSKKYRKPLTSILDNLRTAKNFRQRQLYLVIARATIKADQEIFKKHFAKAIGNDMITEKVKVVQIMMAKLCNEVPEGYSKSIEKVRSKLRECRDLAQYLNTNERSQHQLLTFTDEEEEKKASDDANGVSTLNVNIRFANYSMLSKSGQTSGTDISSLFNSHLMALLGGMMGNMKGGEMFDKSEEALLKSNPGLSNWQS